MKLIEYLKETKVEMSHVSWPTKMQAIIYTSLVIGIALIMSGYLGLFDYLFSKGISSVVSEHTVSDVASSTSTASSTTTFSTDSTSTIPIQKIKASDLDIDEDGNATIRFNE